MPSPDFTILYVDSPEKSGAFYRTLLGVDPVEASSTFVLFALPNGLKLGLWSRHTVEPRAGAAGGEIAFTVDEAATVDTTYAAWSGRGLKMLQEPVDMDFGRTFVALDPDGHRLRVFCPGAE